MINMYVYIYTCVSRVQIPDEHIYIHIYTQTQCSYIENDQQMPFGTAYIYHTDVYEKMTI